MTGETDIPFVEAANHFEANAQRDGLVECHALLKTIAVTLMNVSNNIRILGSGPRCGYYVHTIDARIAYPQTIVCLGDRQTDAGR